MDVQEYLRRNGLTVEKVLKMNLDHLVPKIEEKFNTKVLEYGIEKRGSNNSNDISAFDLVGSNNANYICYMYLPIDDCDNIITEDYYEKSKACEKVDINNPLDQFKTYDFRNILNQDTEVCDFINSEFKGGNIHNMGAIRVDHSKYKGKLVNNIEKIDDVKYRKIFYFSNDNLVTL